MFALSALSSSVFAQEIPYTATADGQTLTFKEVAPSAYYTYENGTGVTLNNLEITATNPDSVSWIGFSFTNNGKISGTSSITATNGSSFDLINNGTISGTLTLNGDDNTYPYLRVEDGTVFDAGTS